MPHELSAGVNALSQWARGVLYANPPFILTGAWLQHCREHGLTCVLIAPQWDVGARAAPWWPVLAFSQEPRLLLAQAGTPGVFTTPTGPDGAARAEGPCPWPIWAFLLRPGEL
jgi:hypothetical protein